MKCPACDFELTEMEFGGVKVDACHGGCGGIWFDAFELQRVDEQREVPTEHLLRIECNPHVKVDPARKRACPRCVDMKLGRHFFSARRQVEVDHCPSCAGYWLDAGELEAIRAEKVSEVKTAKSRATSLSMETIRFLYRQKLERKGE